MDVDTSSYPKAVPGKSALDTVKDLGSIRQQQLSISQSQLDQVNQAYTYLLREVQGLPEDATHDDLVRVVKSAEAKKLIPPGMSEKFVQDIPNDPQSVKNFRTELAVRGADVINAINYRYGAPGSVNNNQTLQPTRQKIGQPPLPSGAPIQLQPGIDTEVPTPEGMQRLGPQQPSLPVGTKPVSGGLPGQYEPIGAAANPRRVNALPVGPINNPAIPGQSSNFKGDVIGATAEAPQIIPRGPMTSRAPLYEAGQKYFVEDQNLATEKLTQIKPALQALPLLKGLRSGPGTGTWNDVVARLKAAGVLSIDNVNDKTAVYQEVSKKLAQYLQGNPLGQRSDNAAILAEAASPSPKTQINPALIKLTRDAVALDRVQAARSGAFKDENGNTRRDMQNYGEHRSTFPASMDERAFTLDLMEPKEREDLLDKMKKQTKIVNGKMVPTTFESKKFWKSLEIVDKQGLINTSGQ